MNSRTVLTPLIFGSANDRERGEYRIQLDRLKEAYADEAEFLEPVPVGDPVPDCDALVFPQLLGDAYDEYAAIRDYGKSVIVLTSEFATIEMWDWEIATFLREEGVTVFTPYNLELGKVVLRAIAAKKRMAAGGKFLMFQDDPGEGMQPSLFKRMFWWGDTCKNRLTDAFGIRLVYRSWRELNNRARAIGDDAARAVCAGWDIPMEAVPESAYLKAVKLYMAIKEEIDREGDVLGCGANCLNESALSDSTPCLAWDVLFRQDGILWACEGDLLSAVSMYIIHSSLRTPLMMSNIYPFLMGMAALKHEKIQSFPEVENPDNHALFVHCGYMGCVPQSLCSRWTLRPKVLEIVGDEALMIDCELKKGPSTIVKLHPGMKKLLVIDSEIEDYVQYPGSDCRNGALVSFADGHDVMESLYSHHALLMTGRQRPALRMMAEVFGLTSQCL